MAIARCVICLLIFGIPLFTATALAQSNGLSEPAQVDPIQGDSGDLALIRQTLADYIQGSTNGQPKRLREAFHPNLNLYSIRNKKLQVWAGTDYIKDTKEGQPTGEQGTILAVDFENDCAVAKVRISPPQGASYIDYFMLLKIEDKWTIVHKMYTRENATAGASGEWKPDSANKASATKEPSSAEKPKQGQASLNPTIDAIFAEYDKLSSPGVAVCVTTSCKCCIDRSL